MKDFLLTGTIAIAFAVATAFAASAAIVPGTSNPYLAGMPDGTTSTRGGVTDIAPAQSPVLFATSVSGGNIFQFSATGSVSSGPADGTGPFDGPDGDIDLSNFGFVSHLGGAENGISGITAPAHALLGVFLSNALPTASAAPTALNFSAAGIGVDFLTLSPDLQQLFFIGDGSTSSAVVQAFIAPVGATRLYLGPMDGVGWFNNAGQFTVSAVPLPAAFPLFSSGLGILGLFGWWRRRRMAAEAAA